MSHIYIYIRNEFTTIDILTVSRSPPTEKKRHLPPFGSKYS